jgi:uncharacterized membrane protein
MTWRGTTTAGDRILACLPYLLTLVSAYPFSLSLTIKFPLLQVILFPLVLPGDLVYSFIPLAPRLIIFLALFILVVRNEKIKHLIRFNTMQSLMISILLSLLTILWYDVPLISQFLSLGLVGFFLSSFVFIAAFSLIFYSVFQTLRGRYAEVPVISEAAYIQVR